MLTALAVAGGAAIGAPCRYLLDRFVQARHEQRFPWGTLLINLLGSAVLGVLIGLSSGRGLPSAVFAAAGTGWCGAFTTYSTFGYETIQLARDGFGLRALANVIGSVAGGLTLATLGVVVGRGIGAL
jgi:fluoride exporter